MQSVHPAVSTVVVLGDFSNEDIVSQENAPFCAVEEILNHLNLRLEQMEAALRRRSIVCPPTNAKVKPMTMDSVSIFSNSKYSISQMSASSSDCAYDSTYKEDDFFSSEDSLQSFSSSYNSSFSDSSGLRSTDSHSSEYSSSDDDHLYAEKHFGVDGLENVQLTFYAGSAAL